MRADQGQFFLLPRLTDGAAKGCQQSPRDTKGRWLAVRAATQGECSKSPRRRTVKLSSSSALISLSFSIALTE
ncbi:MAG: hypothetical protein M3Q46_09035 [Verrucomicrobiota bacterium]|nr:hypothetical protein [Verrucomicrobiota bacterium]